VKLADATLDQNQRRAVVEPAPIKLGWRASVMDRANRRHAGSMTLLFSESERAMFAIGSD